MDGVELRLAQRRACAVRSMMTSHPRRHARFSGERPRCVILHDSCWCPRWPSVCAVLQRDRCHSKRIDRVRMPVVTSRNGRNPRQRRLSSNFATRLNPGIPRAGAWNRRSWTSSSDGCQRRRQAPPNITFRCREARTGLTRSRPARWTRRAPDRFAGSRSVDAPLATKSNRTKRLETAEPAFDDRGPARGTRQRSVDRPLGDSRSLGACGPPRPRAVIPPTSAWPLVSIRRGRPAPPMPQPGTGT
jgi:hypothetical protein